MIDDWWEMLIVGAIILAVLCLVLYAIGSFLRRGGKIKAGPLEAASKSGDTAAACGQTMMQAEHSALLDELVESVGQLTDGISRTETIIRGLDRMQRAQNFAIDVLLGQAVGEKKNGQIGEARNMLSAGQGYKDATQDATERSEP